MGVVENSTSYSNIFHKMWGNSYPLNIFHDSNVCDSNLVKYCDSWGYNYISYIKTFDETFSEIGYTFFIKEPITDINFDQSLSFLSDIASNVDFIAFHECEDYIIRNGVSLTHENIIQEIDDINLPYHILNDILSEGFPRLTTNGILLHRSYRDMIFRKQNLSFKIPVIMPNFIPNRSGNNIMTNSSSKIPKIIHQTFQTRLLPEYIVNATHAWLDRNPDYDYYYYDDRDQRKFIEQHFDNDVLKAYDKLIPGAYKADLWRYCVIYIKGGVYIDIKMGPYVPLKYIIDPDTDLVIVNDTHNGTIYNAFFAAAPGHPSILKTIEITVQRVLRGEYGDHILYPTGPMAMGYAILPIYGFVNHAPNGKHISDLGTLQVYSHTSNNGWTTINDINGKQLIRTRYSKPFGEEGYLHKITGSPHYRLLWQQRAIYKS